MYPKKQMSRLLYHVLLIVLLIVFFVSGYYVLDYMLESRKQGSRYDDLAAIVESMESTEPNRTFDDPESETMGEKPMISAYEKLHKMNDHMVGWIKIEGTDINYPVMQTPQHKDYYLDRNFDREYSAHGCIYVREECDLERPSDNVTIYGHHMKDGSMFSDLDGYLKKDFWEDHPVIRFDSLTDIHEYQIFAIFKTSATIGEGFEYHNFIDAATQEDFDWFVRQCKTLSFYDTGITPEYGDKLISLSTCEYTLVNGRLVVVAVRTN